MSIFKRYYQFLFRYLKSFIAFSFVLGLGTILENLNPYFYKLLVDRIPQRNYQELMMLLFVFVGVRVTANLLETLSYYLGDRILIPAARDARTAVFRHIQDLDFAFHVNKNTGSLISAFKRGDSAFFDLFHQIHHNIGRILISLLVVFFFFGKILPLIAGILLVILVGNIFLGWRLIRINMRKRTAFNAAEDRISGVITDNLINYETVKFFAQEEREERRLKIEFKDWMTKLWEYANSFRLIDITIGGFSNLGIFLIFWLVIKNVVQGQLTAGDFVMVATFIGGFYYQFFNILYQSRNIAKGYVDIERYFSILDDEIQVRNPAKPVKAKDVKGEIKFEKVSFSYPDSKEKVLSNFNLLIRPGDSVAFIGRSGAGKTTLVRLLLRFYDVSQGRITLDGIDIRNFSKDYLRSLIGIVPQEPILFDNTIAYNISYGKSRASSTEIIKAAKMANLHKFIDSLPLKYKTEVGERGIKLSGGQKQRLAIARMLLINPKIIIFDEATSNLDSESERLIQRALWKIAKSRTVLIIAHRFSTTRRANRIVVIDNGRITETGTHQDLVEKKKGIYQYLWQLQATGEMKK